MAAQQGVLALRERRDAMKGKPRRPAPHHDVAMLEPEALVLSLRFRPPNRKIAGRPSDTETIGAPKSLLVLVLMQRHPRARFIAIDQAGIRRETRQSPRVAALLPRASETTDGIAGHGFAGLPDRRRRSDSRYDR